MNWDLFDFACIGVLLLGVAFTYEVIARKQGPIVYKVAVGVALGAAALLLWVNAAVGVIGNQASPANLMYLGVLAAAIGGSLIVRFRPAGMARVMFATAMLQMSVPGIALIAWPPYLVSWGAAGVVGVFALNGAFVGLFVLSALLFRRAERSRAAPGTQ